MDKAYADHIGAEISAGHAFDKHVIEQGEFPGVTTREQFARVIKDALMSGEFRTLSRGRSAYRLCPSRVESIGSKPSYRPSC